MQDSNYSCIVKGLYLGDMTAAESRSFLTSNKIRLVINVTKDIPHHYKEKLKCIEYVRFPISDNLKQNELDRMEQYLPCAVEMIHKSVDIEQKNVFVHCWAGRQRSAVCIAAYLVKYRKMTPSGAIKAILRKRPEAFHFGQSINFELPLKKFAKTCK